MVEFRLWVEANGQGEMETGYQGQSIARIALNNSLVSAAPRLEELGFS
jgi:hypothetical protein